MSHVNTVTTGLIPEVVCLERGPIFPDDTDTHWSAVNVRGVGNGKGSLVSRDCQIVVCVGQSDIFYVSRNFPEKNFCCCVCTFDLIGEVYV